ncbi:MAG: hypothetical protein V1918_06420 [Planctomycetota bacterium]
MNVVEAAEGLNNWYRTMSDSVQRCIVQLGAGDETQRMANRVNLWQAAESLASGKLQHGRESYTPLLFLLALLPEAAELRLDDHFWEASIRHYVNWTISLRRAKDEGLCISRPPDHFYNNLVVSLKKSGLVQAAPSDLGEADRKILLSNAVFFSVQYLLATAHAFYLEHKDDKIEKASPEETLREIGSIVVHAPFER